MFDGSGSRGAILLRFLQSGVRTAEKHLMKNPPSGRRVRLITRTSRASALFAMGVLCQCGGTTVPLDGAPGSENTGQAVSALTLANVVLGPLATPGAWLGSALDGVRDVDQDGYDDILVGALGEEAVYFFRGGPNGLDANPAWTLTLVGSGLGSAVAGAGDVNGDGYADVLLGMPTGQGRADLYYGGPAGLSGVPGWSGLAQGAAATAFGSEVASAGDVNADGFDDILISEHDALGGAVHLFLGGPAGPNASADWSAHAPPAPFIGTFGSSLAALGDANGDGYDDVVIGTSGSPFSDYFCDLACLDASGGCTGCCCGTMAFPATAHAQVFLGGATGLQSTPALDLPFPDPLGMNAIIAVGGVGDLNGDGFSDLALGLTNEWNTGQVVVHLGSASGIDALPAWSMSDPFPGSAFGASVTGPGDMDGDGLDDLLVGSYCFGAPTWICEGRVYLFSGMVGGLTPLPSWVADPTDEDFTLLGVDVARAGDLDGDGAADMLASAPGFPGFPAEGRVYAFYGDACAGVPEGAACNDHDACTQVDACQSGVCVGGSPVVCTALDACHDVGSCDATTGLCTTPAAADGAPCDDGDACTQVDACQSGVCVGGSPVICTALDACHDVGSCDATTGLCTTPAAADGAPCDDGDACTQVDACQSGVCVGGSPVVCTALDACHDVGSCDAATGLCATPAAADGALCDDGDACTQGDACQSGVCSGNPVVCNAIDECHAAGACDAANGLCSNVPQPDGVACSLGLCVGGVCVPPEVDDDDPADAEQLTASGGCALGPSKPAAFPFGLAGLAMLVGMRRLRRSRASASPGPCPSASRS